MRKQLTSFAQVIKFCKISSSRGVLAPTPPLRTPLITWQLGIGDKHFDGAEIVKWLSVRLSVKGWGDSTATEWINVYSLGKSVHLNCPAKKRISGVSLPQIAVTKVLKNITSNISCYFWMLIWIFSISAMSCSLVFRWVSTLNFGDWSEEFYKVNVAQFQYNCCFSAWRNSVGKWRSWNGIVQLVCLRG